MMKQQQVLRQATVDLVSLLVRAPLRCPSLFSKLLHLTQTSSHSRTVAADESSQYSSTHSVLVESIHPPSSTTPATGLAVTPAAAPPPVRHPSLTRSESTQALAPLPARRSQHRLAPTSTLCRAPRLRHRQAPQLQLLRPDCSAPCCISLAPATEEELRPRSQPPSKHSNHGKARSLRLFLRLAHHRPPPVTVTSSQYEPPLRETPPPYA